MVGEGVGDTGSAADRVHSEISDAVRKGSVAVSNEFEAEGKGGVGVCVTYGFEGEEVR